MPALRGGSVNAPLIADNRRKTGGFMPKYPTLIAQ